MRGQVALLAVAVGLVLSGCATSEDPPAQAQAALAANDPFEPMNRTVFDMNQGFDKMVLLPVAQAYVDVVPEPARDSVHNVLDNLSLPVTFANDLLQGELDRAGDTFSRFTINTTIGIGGLIDVASNLGIPDHSEDFGQTLGVYGVGEGPYLVVPFFGPDPPRDAAGQIVDIFLDPTTYIHIDGHIYWSAGEELAQAVDLRSRSIDQVESIERSSVDYYASVRSLYRQHRNNEIRNGKPDVKNLPDF
ncbi:MAG TPA: VacJ family lipoprotein [Rhizomicrobium sp.]|nr:VacJ family lipoprotein [Rhizomicrobium sp.]